VRDRLRSRREERGKRPLVVAGAAWWGGGEVLPVGQALSEELGERGFTPVTVALDKSFEDARPYIERAAPGHPALVDTEHVTADLFNIINVPTMIWIDERGRIVRPNDVQFGTDTFVALTGRPS